MVVSFSLCERRDGSIATTTKSFPGHVQLSRRWKKPAARIGSPTGRLSSSSPRDSTLPRRRPFFLAPIPPPPAKLSSRISLRLVRISKRVHTRLFALFLPPSRAHDRQTNNEEMGRKRFRVFSYTSPSRGEGVDATSLSLVVHGRKFKFRDGGETGEEPASIRRERTLLYLSMRSDRSTPSTNSWDRSSVLERLHLDRSNRGSRHRDNS